MGVKGAGVGFYVEMEKQYECFTVLSEELSIRGLKTDRNVVNLPSKMAQRQRVGPITQRSVDRNYLLLAGNLGSINPT